MIILIADDDRLIRFTMKSMLSEILRSDYVFLEAANGKKMVEVCKEKLPDIVFADIKMPYMDGITAIEECQKYAKDTEFVVISGYSEFEYAKRCISLGINEYLLKPVEEEKLRELMEKLNEKCLRRNRDSNSQFQLKCLNAFNYFSTIGIDREYEEFSYDDGFQYEIIGLAVKGLKCNQKEYIEFQRNILDSMQDFGLEFIKKHGFYTNLYSPGGMLYFAFCTTSKGREHVIAQIGRIGRKNRNLGLAFHFIEFEETSLKNIYRTCDRLDEECVFTMNYELGAVISLSSVHMSEADLHVLQLVNHLLDAWDGADAVTYKSTINELYREYKDTAHELNLKYISRYCECIMGYQISDTSFKEFCRCFVERSEGMYRNVDGNDSDIINSTKKYVEQYYMNDISISEIAERFSITPNYLSTVFHQRTGGKFIDYLTEVRILHAKKLLIQNSSASVKDIAVMVGYNSARHFSTLFQKLTGVTPTGYRANNKLAGF